MRDFRLALEEHFRTVQTVGGYAELLGVSADHLGQVSREHTGRQVSDVMRARIVLEGKRLLYALNFEDPAYFFRYFRRLSGQSPGEFRESLLEAP